MLRAGTSSISFAPHELSIPFFDGPLLSEFFLRRDWVLRLVHGIILLLKNKDLQHTLLGKACITLTLYLFIHDGSNDKSLGPVSQGTGSPIFHTRGATGNWTPVGILENSYRSLHARSLRVACSHIGCTLQAPNLVGNNPSTFPGWFLRMFRVTPFMLTTRAWESTLVAGTFHFILICLYHYLFAEFFPWW